MAQGDYKRMPAGTAGLLGGVLGTIEDNLNGQESPLSSALRSHDHALDSMRYAMQAQQAMAQNALAAQGAQRTATEVMAQLQNARPGSDVSKLLEELRAMQMRRRSRTEQEAYEAEQEAQRAMNLAIRREQEARLEAMYRREQARREAQMQAIMPPLMPTFVSDSSMPDVAYYGYGELRRKTRVEVKPEPKAEKPPEPGERKIEIE